MSGFPNSAGTIFEGSRRADGSLMSDGGVVTVTSGAVVTVKKGETVTRIDPLPDPESPRVGRVYYALLLGGASTDLTTRKMNPEVLKDGYEAVLTRHAEEARRFGAVNMLLLNPGGTVNGEMEFDQWPKMWPDPFDRAKHGESFAWGVRACIKELGVAPIVYLGSVKPDMIRGINMNWHNATASCDRLRMAVLDVLQGISSECPIVIDGAGSDTDIDAGGGLSWDVANIIRRNRKGGVGCEPWPMLGGPWADDRSTFGVTQLPYLRKIWDPATPEGKDYGAKIDRSRCVVERQITIASDSPETDPAELVTWLSRGVSVAVVSRGGLYHGYTARQLERMAAREVGR